MRIAYVGTISRPCSVGRAESSPNGTRALSIVPTHTISESHSLPRVISTARAAHEGICDEVPDAYKNDRADQRPDDGHTGDSEIADARNDDDLRHQPDADDSRNDRTNEAEWQ